MESDLKVFLHSFVGLSKERPEQYGQFYMKRRFYSEANYQGGGRGGMRPWERAGDSRLLRNERGTDVSPSAPGSSRGHILELQESGVHELQPESSLGWERESRSSLVQAKVVPMALAVTSSGL